jgi:hypothetical protein
MFQCDGCVEDQVMGRSVYLQPVSTLIV